MDAKYLIIDISENRDHVEFTDATYIPDDKRPTTGYWDRERAEKELLRLKLRYPKGEFVLYQAMATTQRTGEIYDSKCGKIDVSILKEVEV